jgi:diguanylate cyclase (GGDEF)-like protein
VRIVRVARCPDRTQVYDAAIVLADESGVLPARIPDLPTVVVGPGAYAQDCADLVRRGVQHGLTAECAACPRQSNLARSLMWVIERGRLIHTLERARRREHHMALHDGLTGLPNMQLCRERLRRLLAQAHRKSKHVAVLYLDLDRFKEVNDRLGHAAGDHMLREVAGRLRACTRETDTVARRGGDEFVILLDDVRGRDDAVRVAGKILAFISRPCRVQRSVVRPSASIGIAIFPADGSVGEALERRADLAMYAAKQGRGTVVAYSDDLDHFDPARVGRYADAKVQQLLADPGIVRNRLKIHAAIQNAQMFQRVQEEFGTFDRYLWPFVGDHPQRHRYARLAEIPARTAESEAMSS